MKPTAKPTILNRKQKKAAVLDANLPHLDKHFEQTEPLLLTFLRMELASDDVVLPDTGSEFQTVFGCRADPTGILRYYIIGMNEIEIRSVWSISEKGRRRFHPNRIPAHVRDRKLFFGPIAGYLKPHHPAFDHIQTSMNSELLSLCKQKLQPQTQS